MINQQRKFISSSVGYRLLPKSLITKHELILEPMPVTAKLTAQDKMIWHDKLLQSELQACERIRKNLF